MIWGSLCVAFYLVFFLQSPLHAETSQNTENHLENTPETPKGMVKVDGDQAAMNRADGGKAPFHHRPFYIDQYEVTYSQYLSIMGKPPPGEYAGGESPVLSLTYHQAKEYCDRVGKRLPIAMEWELAGRAGYRWRNPWGHYRGHSRGYGDPRGYPSVEYPGDGYGYYGKEGAWSYGQTDDFSVYRDSHYSDDVYSKYGLRCAR